MPLGPPLIYLLKNCRLFFTGLFDERYFSMIVRPAPTVEDRRIRGQAADSPDHSAMGVSNRLLEAMGSLQYPRKSPRIRQAQNSLIPRETRLICIAH
jgi:hypothetical protein